MSRATWPPLREELRGIEPYGAPQLSLEQAPVQLNVNENPYGPSPEAAADIARAVGAAAVSLNRYPDREFVELRSALAAYLDTSGGSGITPEMVWAANGSNEVLQQLLQVFGGAGRTALGFTPSYSMHPVITATTGTAWVDGGRRADFTLDPFEVGEQVRGAAADVVFLTSPNNPTGTALGLDVVEAAYAATTGIVVVDEAYAEFARPGTPSATSLLPGRPRLVVTRTMSKAFALAGARVGYLAADPAVVDALRLVRLPYHLSALTQACARAALAHTGVLLSTVGSVEVSSWSRSGRMSGSDLDSVSGDRLDVVRRLTRRCQATDSTSSGDGLDLAQPLRLATGQQPALVERDVDHGAAGAHPAREPAHLGLEAHAGLQALGPRLGERALGFLARHAGHGGPHRGG